MPFPSDISSPSIIFTVDTYLVKIENRQSAFTKKISIIYSIDKICEKIYIFGMVKINSGDANELV
jgi:hypothetical protein